MDLAVAPGEKDMFWNDDEWTRVQKEREAFRKKQEELRKKELKELRGREKRKRDQKRKKERKARQAKQQAEMDKLRNKQMGEEGGGAPWEVNYDDSGVGVDNNVYDPCAGVNKEGASSGRGLNRGRGLNSFHGGLNKNQQLGPHQSFEPKFGPGMENQPGGIGSAGRAPVGGGGGLRRPKFR